MRDPSDTLPSFSPLIQTLAPIYDRILRLKEETRRLYFDALLSHYRCPKCAGHLQMAGYGRCVCSCGNTFDPTVAFQKSCCCGAPLRMKISHYACSNCGKIVPSRFIFDERVFDRAYFKEMMRNSRERAKRKRDELRIFLSETRSGALPLFEGPSLGEISGLEEALNDFIGSKEALGLYEVEARSRFVMDDYRWHILSALGWGSRLFSSINLIAHDRRLDKVRRFITLIFMQHEKEVQLTQLSDDLLIERVTDETYD